MHNNKFFIYKQAPIGKLFNVCTGNIIKYSKSNIKRIREQLKKKLLNNDITKISYQRNLKKYLNKVIEEEKRSCDTKDMIWCEETYKCFKDTIQNRLNCGFILTEDQIEEITKESKQIEKKRKNADYQYTEYLFAVALKNPDMEFDIETIEKVKNINIEPATKSKYIKDLKDSYKNKTSKKNIKTWFNNAKDKINQFYNTYPEKLDLEKLNVYLTGKKSSFRQVSMRQDKVRGSDKINKGDVYLISNKTFIGFSIKKDPKAQSTNWSIEKLINHVNTKQYEELKDVKNNFISELGIELMSASKYEKTERTLKLQIRDKFNVAMRKKNIYTDKINELIMSNEEYFLSEIITGIGAKTSYPTYFFNGKDFYNLNTQYSIYEQKFTNKELSFLDDNKSNNSNLKKFGLKEHYSVKAGKLWYYLKEDKNEFNYRFEIRVKGNLFNSLQIFIHKN